MKEWAQQYPILTVWLTVNTIWMAVLTIWSAKQQSHLQFLNDCIQLVRDILGRRGKYGH